MASAEESLLHPLFRSGDPWLPSASPRGERPEASRLIPVDPYRYLRERETIEEDLDRLPKPLQSRRAIYIMHSPPFGTRLDLIEGGKSTGSRSIKAFIERNQPLLTLHGHIHEAPALSGTYVTGLEKRFPSTQGNLSGQGERSPGFMPLPLR